MKISSVLSLLIGFFFNWQSFAGAACQCADLQVMDGGNLELSDIEHLRESFEERKMTPPGDSRHIQAGLEGIKKIVPNWNFKLNKRTLDDLRRLGDSCLQQLDKRAKVSRYYMLEMRDTVGHAKRKIYLTLYFTRAGLPAELEKKINLEHVTGQVTSMRMSKEAQAYGHNEVRTFTNPETRISGVLFNFFLEAPVVSRLTREGRYSMGQELGREPRGMEDGLPEAKAGWLGIAGEARP